MKLSGTLFICILQRIRINTEWLYDVYVYNFPFIPLSIHTLNGPHALIEILTFSSLA